MAEAEHTHVCAWTKRSIIARDEAAGGALPSPWLEDLVDPYLTVMTLQGVEYRYKLAECSTVAALKHSIFTEQGISFDQQRLIREGCQLADEVLTKPGVYHLVLRLRGGFCDRFHIARTVSTAEVRVVLRRNVYLGEINEADYAFTRLADRVLNLASTEREELLVVEVFTDAALAAYAPGCGAPLRGDRVAGSVLVTKLDIPVAERQGPGLALAFEVVVMFEPEVSLPPGTRLRAQIAPSFLGEITALDKRPRLSAAVLAWFARIGDEDLEGENEDLSDLFSGF